MAAANEHKEHASNTTNPIEGNDLNRLQTTASIPMSPELFEKIYLTPATRVRGELRRTFANPTPLGLVGFVIALTPLSCDLMGWRGTGGNGAAEIGAYYWFGGALQIIGGALEYPLGNTFPFVVLTSFGAFFLTFATTLVPFYNAAAAYDSAAGFHASFGYFPLFMALLCLIYMICALRTNIVFVIIFFSLIIALTMLTGSHWQAAEGNVEVSLRLQVGAGATAFVTSILGWYLLLSQLLSALDAPFQVPVGDLSRWIKSGSERRQQEHSSA